MFSYYFQGLALGAAMILPLGPQNAFVMNQGIRRQYHIMIALLCAISDLGNDSNLLIVFYVQIMPDDFVMQLHRF
ncbi:arginine exporter protein ArgO [Escherichia coli KTE69]|nr:arginine exporter protein ArgO [Escherichia coli KTE143]EOU90191.1 arginine exporter protein ArgO [Escherichia coli KTE37]EOV04182.1 arginine exporter protein ArgO [Escherichia coli KTE38]EOV63007.1 arginine exporter protein ArgO [Escherichia coli KTE69]EOV71388.1 arginine exporter protein ArgO [Escherichia coli KTE70]EOV88747.1 arginine exporter protein ArgO [Escherichia coli KTE74]EQQ04063.1 arginine exporter protein ArgO [Escherichia coli HVH 87 (4-5977630)]EQX80095.1 arginine exporter